MTDEAQHDPLPYILDGLDITTPEDSGFAIIACVNPDTQDGGKSRGQFIVRACNSHYKLLEALEDILGDRPDIQGGICRRCGRDYRGEIRTGNCPSDDCPAYIARAAIAKAKGGAEAATPTCVDRAQWAEKAVTAYARAKEGRVYDPLADIASDLMADLCHLLVREGVLPDLILERAKTHYEEECAEEGIII